MTTEVWERLLALSLQEAPTETKPSDARIWRWMPWLASFTGGRPTEIIQLTGEDLLHRLSVRDQDIACLRLPKTKYRQWPAPLHPGFLEHGLLEMAREHAQSRPFLEEDQTVDVAAQLAVKRYLRRLKNSGVLEGFGGPVFPSLRKHFVTRLYWNGAEFSVVDGLMGRATEPSKFDDGTSAFLAGAKAVAALKWPTLR